MRPAVLGTALRLVSGFPSRRGQRWLVLIPKSLLTGSLWATLYLHKDDLFSRRMGHFGTASTGSWHGYCRTEKEQSTFVRGRKCSFYSRVPLPDLSLIEFDDAMFICNSTIDVRRFFFFRLIHLLRVLGTPWLSYITSRIHSALFA